MTKKRAFGKLGCFVFAGLLMLGPTFSFASAAEKTIELKFATYLPPSSSVTKARLAWIKKIEETSKGRVKITPYYSGSLVPPKDLYVGTAKGICDLADVGGWLLSHIPLNRIYQLPQVGWKSTEVATRIQNDIWKKFPDMREEFKDIKMLYQCMVSPNRIHTVEKIVRIPEDMNGMKILSGGPMASYMSRLGAAPVTLMLTDWAMALNRGMAQGAEIGNTAVLTFNFQKMVKSHTMVEIGMNAIYMVMNPEKWNSLPPDIKKIFEDLEPYGIEQMHIAMQEREDEALKIFKDLGHTIVYPTEEENKKWLATGKPGIEEWIKEGEAEGMPARAIYDEIQRLVAEYSK